MTFRPAKLDCSICVAGHKVAPPYNCFVAWFSSFDSFHKSLTCIGQDNISLYFDNTLNAFSANGLTCHHILISSRDLSMLLIIQSMSVSDGFTFNSDSDDSIGVTKF